MNIAKVDIHIKGPLEFNELDPSCRSFVVNTALDLLGKKYFIDRLAGTSIHVNSMLEFKTEEDLTYFILIFQPFEFNEILDGHNYKITVGII